MAARCEAAGRPKNEDNFQLSDDLSGNQWSFLTNKERILGKKGALLVVCDGMGGMNAGAIASDIAISTVKEWFAADRLTPQVTATPEMINQYIRDVIIAADEQIKEAGQESADLKGMGSTIVLAWLIGENVYIGWCGDSRAYRFNPAFGLERLSHDHSYVQELVDSGKLAEELAFDHPDCNIITRSLGDTRSDIQPDVISYPLCNGDMILLCSDGLSGVLRDSEIEAIMDENAGTVDDCRKALWTESENAGWSDNVTIALVQIIAGGTTVSKTENFPTEINVITKKKTRKRKGLIVALIILLLGIAFEVGYYTIYSKWWTPDFLNSIFN